MPYKSFLFSLSPLSFSLLSSLTHKLPHILMRYINFECLSTSSHENISLRKKENQKYLTQSTWLVTTTGCLASFQWCFCFNCYKKKKSREWQPQRNRYVPCTSYDLFLYIDQFSWDSEIKHSPFKPNLFRLHTLYMLMCYELIADSE